MRRARMARNSSEVIRSSSKALPLTAPATPIRVSAARSAAFRTPPEACQASCGKRATSLAVQLDVGSGQRAIALDVRAQDVFEPIGRKTGDGVPQAEGRAFRPATGPYARHT